MQILALGPVRGSAELQDLLAGLSQALPGRIELVESDPPAPDPSQPLLLPYLAPHRLLERHGSTAETLERAWSLYGELGRHRSDPLRSAPALPVNLEHCAVPQLVGWLVQPDAPIAAEGPPPAPDPDALLALLTSQFLRHQPAVIGAYAALDPGGDSYLEHLQRLTSPAQLLLAFAELRLLEADLAEQQRQLQQERLDLGHVLDDRDLLSRQLNELHAGFETFHAQASSDAEKLAWHRARRAELELTLKLQQKDLEALTRQVKEQASLIERSATASEQMMQLLAAALAD